MLKYFGTDGVRGKANETLNATVAYRIGRCLGRLKKGSAPKVLVCEDTRLSSEMLRNAIISGLLTSGAEVYDERVSSTPSVSYLVMKHSFDYGVMVSASHNPFDDNGIKIFNRLGEKLEDSIEEIIEEYMDREEDDLPKPIGTKLGRYHDGESLKQEYIEWLKSKSKGDYSKIKVVVDCANGSTSYLAPALFASLGIQATFINSTPNGININAKCGSTHMEGLKKVFDLGGYDFGLAFDGDGDRFLAFGPGGRFIDGDAQIYLHAIEMKKNGLLSKNRAVMTVMSNLGLRKGLAKNGIDFSIVSVGDKYVQAEMKKNELKIGGEQSGHVIFLDDLNTGDGLLSAIHLLDLYVNDPKVYALVKSLKVYPQILKNISFKTKDELLKVATSPVLLKYGQEVEESLHGEGRVLIRSSGTEPLLRIMVEGPTEASCLDAIARIETKAMEVL